jgi:chaperonin GroES
MTAAKPAKPAKLAGSDEADSLPILMLHDRLLVQTEQDSGERRSSSGLVIPATVSMGRRLTWAKIVALGPNVRSVKTGDRVLFDPEATAEVEVRGTVYALLRERDLHAVAASRLAEGQAGLYL